MARRKAKVKNDINSDGVFWVVHEYTDERWSDDLDEYVSDAKQLNELAGPFIDVDTAVGWVRTRAANGNLSLDEEGTVCIVEKVFEFKIKQTVEEVVVRKTTKVK